MASNDGIQYGDLSQLEWRFQSLLSNRTSDRAWMNVAFEEDGSRPTRSSPSIGISFKDGRLGLDWSLVLLDQWILAPRVQSFLELRGLSVQRRWSGLEYLRIETPDPAGTVEALLRDAFGVSLRQPILYLMVLDPPDLTEPDPNDSAE